MLTEDSLNLPVRAVAVVRRENIAEETTGRGTRMTDIKKMGKETQTARSPDEMTGMHEYLRHAWGRTDNNQCFSYSTIHVQIALSLYQRTSTLVHV